MSKTSLLLVSAIAASNLASSSTSCDAFASRSSCASRTPPAFQLSTRITEVRKCPPYESSRTALFLFGMNGKKDSPNNESNSNSNQVDVTSKSDDNNETFLSKLGPTIKIALPSFFLGTIATLSVLFLPLLSDYYDAFSGASSQSNFYGETTSSASNGGKTNNINQPVILFETILNDLNDAYVDDVDIQKLFETGVKAMTSSLDPYTEFESRQEAQDLEEVVSGRYGGVGLVIRGNNKLAMMQADDEDLVLEMAEPAVNKDNGNDKERTVKPPVAVKNTLQDEGDDPSSEKAERKRKLQKSMEDGIRVVSAFEGYAYDAGLRVGDKLLAIDDFQIKPTTSVDEVRNHLRGEPGTPVSITFLREGVGGEKNEPQTISMERAVVHIPDVKYYGYIGDPKDGIGYIDLSGFANDAGREVRYAIRVLQHGAEMIARSNDGGVTESDEPGRITVDSIDTTKLKGLVLDLRGNPGGLLTSAVDVATLFVPNGSDIVSAKGRGFPETLYRSRTEPILNPNTRLAVLVNEQTASAAEIVTGAVQDLDVGVVVGKGRTFGKGLVQNVQDLPYQTALKYTVAKYYTPSGRCIQSTIYGEGGRGANVVDASSDEENESFKPYKAKKVADKDRMVFLTAHGREVKDGGGIEVDYKVDPETASPIEVILLNSGMYTDFAAEWSKHNVLTDNFKVDDATYKEFQRFVEKRQKEGDLKLEALYDAQLSELKKKLIKSKFDSASRELEKLRSDIIADVKKDFKTYKNEIIEDLEQSILARYLPESMLIERSLKSDLQVIETAKMLKNEKQFNTILARDKLTKENNYNTATTLEKQAIHAN
ncbi:hypothetical protein HJC23_010718 [Cyclotella cryptica]|uniref:PDZ domain-containing protein n=1 Tax=Cyclotella cryptica TaxID=29204 RepID=A0ABD3PDJ5_9STRA